MTRFAIWGDEIAYEHKVVAKFVVGSTTVRDHAEEDILNADPEQAEKDRAAEIKILEDEWNKTLTEKDSEIDDLREKVADLERALDAVDDVGGPEFLRATLEERDTAVKNARAWRDSYDELKRKAEASAGRRPRKATRAKAELLS